MFLFFPLDSMRLEYTDNHNDNTSKTSEDDSIDRISMVDKHSVIVIWRSAELVSQLW